MAEQQSALGALIELEREELARYCEGVEVKGEIAQTATLKFKRGQTLWTSKGTLMSYTQGIDWTLKIPGGAKKAISRMFSGEGLSLVHVTAEEDNQSVVLSANQPGKLATWDLSRGPIVCTSGAFVAALGDVDIDVTVAKSAGAAFFGGAGLFMQKLSGEGIAIIHGSGDFIEYELDANESLLVSTGNLAVFSGGVEYNVRGVGGCRKMFFGGEGMFMTELTGPGWVMLQSLKKLPVAQQAQR